MFPFPYAPHDRPTRYCPGTEITLYCGLSHQYVTCTIKKVLGSGYFKTAYLADLDGETVVFKDPHQASDAWSFAECYAEYAQKGLPCPELLAADFSTGQVLCEKAYAVGQQQFDDLFAEVCVITEMAEAIYKESQTKFDETSHTLRLMAQTTWDTKAENYGLTQNGRLVVIDL